MAKSQGFQMSQEHRDVLRENTIYIKENLLYGDKFEGYLQQNRVLTDDMVDEIEAQGTRGSKINKFIFYLTKRGPTAFENFIMALRYSNQVSMADKLSADALAKERRSVQATDNAQGSVVAASGGVVCWNIKDGMKPYDPSRLKEMTNLECYPMHHNPRGHAIIVNNCNFENPDAYPTRIGSEEDIKRMNKVLTDFHFAVHIIEDQNSKGMFRYLDNFRKSVELEKSDAFILVLMSHGDKDHIVCVNGISKSVEELTSLFDGNNCPYLIGKPKIFIIQACRGDLKTRGNKAHDGPTERIEVGEFVKPEVQTDGTGDKRHEKADMLYIYSTVYGYTSFRPNTGSWFIEILYEELMEHACDTDLHKIIKQVTRKMNDRRSMYQNLQVPEISETGMDKLIYFLPGYPKP